ncbi:MAG: substrate-binding domain-containing protein [Rhodospirillales bacterium]|nr:substrate-binding domain-containing protein [Rhodospirillales bacterium]
MWYSFIRKRPRHFVPILAVALSSLLVAPTAMGATAEAVDRSSLRVCADPGNLPFSNQAGEGFENKIAELLAAQLGVPLRYTWFPQATGFVRNTLMARKCDLVIGISLGFELLQNTNPYYRSSYALVYRADSGLKVSSIADPILKEKRLGIIAGTPPASLMAKYGLLGQVRPYHLVADTRFNQPAKQLVDDIAKGEVDVGVLWGPIAGYYAKDHNPTISVVPLLSNPGEVKMDYRITMGIRFNEPDWKHAINSLIEKKQPEIDAILKAYGVPLLDAQGRPLQD